MSQFDFGVIDPQVKTGSQLANDLNNWRNALNTSHAGAARPPYAQPGTCWVDTSAAPICYLKLFDGTADISILKFDNSTHTGGAVASAAGIPVAPVGNIAATNVQAALQELDNEKLARDGTQAMLGPLVLATNAANPLEAVPLQQLTAAAKFKGYNGILGVNAAITLDATYFGALIFVSGTGYTITLPPATASQPGNVLKFFGAASNVTIKAAGADTMQMNGSIAVTSLILNSGDTLELVGNGAAQWTASAGSLQATYAPSVSGVPTGFVVATASTVTIPTGWLACEGATVSRTTYAALYAAIGTTFNTGGEAGTDFRLPDFRGNFLRGWDTGGTIDPGRAFGSFQTDLERGFHSTGWNDTGNYTGSGQNPGAMIVPAGAMPRTGGAETRPRNVALRFCIKY